MKKTISHYIFARDGVSNANEWQVIAIHTDGSEIQISGQLSSRSAYSLADMLNASI